MKKYPATLALAAVASCISLLSGCQAVKPYQKAYLQEEEMKLNARKLETFESNFQTYREGSAGADGGKVGGGCGCN